MLLCFLRIYAQDFKPANCMLCSNGLIKITDFGAWSSKGRLWLFRKRFEASSSPFCPTHALGLAGFSHKLDKDPWNQEKNLNGEDILCAHLEGGTVIYMCPEQLWVISESKKIDKAADQPLYLALKDRWQITPATSDMSQVSLTVLEMHARASRWFGPGAVSRLEAVGECASRVSSSVVFSMTPAEAEQWAVETLGIDKLAGKIESAGIDGAKMLELSKMSLSDAKKAHKGMSNNHTENLSKKLNLNLPRVQNTW